MRTDAVLRTLFLLLPILVTGGASASGNPQRLSASITCTIEQGFIPEIGVEAALSSSTTILLENRYPSAIIA